MHFHKPRLVTTLQTSLALWSSTQQLGKGNKTSHENSKQSLVHRGTKRQKGNTGSGQSQSCSSHTALGLRPSGTSFPRNFSSAPFYAAARYSFSFRGCRVVIEGEATRAVHAASSYARALHLPGHCVIPHGIYCTPFKTVSEERDCSFLYRLFQALSIMEYELSTSVY